MAVDVVEGTEQTLSFTQSASQIRLTLPAGDSYRYISVAGSTSPAFVRGDCNSDGVSSSLADAMFLLFHNFSDAAGPECAASCDVNGDGDIGGVSDVVYTLMYGFAAGPGPAAPYPDCGEGELSSDDELGCGSATSGCP